MDVPHVPTVHLDHHLDDYLSGEVEEGDALATVQAIGDALAQWGFVSLTGHGIPYSSIEKGYHAAAQLFALPEERKCEFEDVEGGRQRGYTPLLMERAKGQAEGDLKEFWHIGRELPDHHHFRTNGSMRPNLFPDELPDARISFFELYRMMDQLAHQMLHVIERYFKLTKHALSSLAIEGNSVLRVLHYPELESMAERSAGSVRAAAHEDINLLTLLPAATQPGLQLLTREGQWLDINPPAGSMILDTGDMMNALTGGALPSTTHRVINPEGGVGGARFSMPFFMHPRPDAVLTPLLTNSGGLNMVEGSGLTAQEFLARRLEENGLMVDVHAEEK